MFRHEHDSDNQVPARPFHRRAQNYVPEAGWDGGSHHQRARRAAFTIVARPNWPEAAYLGIC